MGSDSIYHKLVELEREMDYKISRKQTQIADAAFKVAKVKRTLKIFVSHTTNNQRAETGDTEMETGGEPPSWTVRIEGRVDHPGRASRASPKSFLHYIKSLVAQLGSASSTEAITADTVEWVKGPTTLEGSDGFEIKRRGGTDVPIKIVIKLDDQPERYRSSAELSRIVLDKELVTKPAAVLAIWQYVKTHKLQESDEKKMVRCDETLRDLFEATTISFTDIPKKLEPHLLPAEPLVLEYMVTMERAGGVVWEFDVDVDDPGKVRPTAANIVAQQREIGLLEHRIHEVGNALKAAAIHERILRYLAQDPLGCIRRLMDAQCADQLVATGEPPITVDDLFRSANFDTEEVEKAIALFCSPSSESSFRSRR